MLKRALLAGRSATWLRQVRLCLKCYMQYRVGLFLLAPPSVAAQSLKVKYFKPSTLDVIKCK
jgi:hypothetical protein